MRRLCFSLLLLASLGSLAGALQPEWVNATPEEIKAWLGDLDSANAARRNDALDQLTLHRKELKPPVRSKVMTHILTALADTRAQSLARQNLAYAWSQWVTGPDPVMFERCSGFFTDADPDVRRHFWDSHLLTGRLPEKHLARLLKLGDHPSLSVRRTVMNWAQDGNGSDRQYFAMLWPHAQDQDPVCKLAALRGLFKRAQVDPDRVHLLLRRHLEDPVGAYRQLAVQELASEMDAPDLKETVLKRFRACRDSASVFGIKRDFSNEGEESERLLLLLALARMGPLPEEVWTYLEGPGLRAWQPAELLTAIAGEGERAQPLAGQVLARASKEDTQQLVHYIASGVNESGVPALLALAREDNDRRTLSAALVSLANSRLGSSAPAVIQLAIASLPNELPPDGAAYAISRLDPAGPGAKPALAAVDSLLADSQVASRVRTDALVAAALNLKSPRASAALQEHLKGYADRLRRGKVSRRVTCPEADTIVAYLLWLEATQPQKIPALRPGLQVLKGAGCQRLQKVASRLAP